MGNHAFGPRPETDPHDDLHFRDHGFTPAPRLVQWMVTGACAGSCAHCMTAPGLAQTPLTLEEARGLLDDVARLGVDELLITGGEPLERPDLPEIIDALRERGQRWSLNTARAPRGDALRAMEAWPPCFAAVSVDGPAALHDRLRGRTGAFAEAQEAIAVFLGLTDGHVAAGTTVTRLNLGLLAETFPAVVASGASAWGLHLVVPEGRAAGNPDLLLRPDEVAGLIAFTAAKRAWFPVTMADELGYCGALEPLVRDRPFFCGAGRTQCVVLPDGAVTACTTFDPRHVAGNVRHRPLPEIWATGFAGLRRAAPDPACAACAFAPACHGGCWLMRNHRVHCHRPVWDPVVHAGNQARGSVGARGATAARGAMAGLAVCLGLAACAPAKPTTGDPVPPQGMAPAMAPSTEPDAKAPAMEPDRKATTPDPAMTPPTDPAGPPASPPGFGRLPAGLTTLDAVILHWVTRGQVAAFTPARALELTAWLGEDPARPFLFSVLAGEAPPDWPKRAARLLAAAGSTHPSLHLISLLWRDLAAWCQVGPEPARRAAAEQELLVRVLAALDTTTTAWRKTIFTGRLQPFFHRDDPENRRPFLSKAGPPPIWRLHHQSLRRHWAVDDLSAELTEAYLKAHPFAEHLILRLDLPAGKKLEVPAPGRPAGGTVPVGLFGWVRVPGKAPITVHVTVRGRRLPVILPAGATLAWADLARLLCAQNAAAVDALIDDDPGTESELVLAPALRARLARLAASSPATPDFARRIEALRARLLSAELF